MSLIYIALALVVVYLADKAFKAYKSKRLKPKAKRTRNKKGRFVADNPNTSKNEAWVEANHPKKILKKLSRKSKFMT